MALDAYLILASYYAAFLLRHDVLGGMVTIDVRSDGYIYLSLVYAAMMVLCFYLPVRVAAGGEGHGQYLEDRVGRRTGHCAFDRSVLPGQDCSHFPAGPCDSMAA